MSMVIGGAMGGSSGASLSGAGAAFLGAVVRAKFIPASLEAGFLPVLFSFSPKDVKVERKTVTSRNSNVQTGQTGANWMETKPAKYTFTAYLEGETTKVMGDKLLGWMCPGGAGLEAAIMKAAFGGGAVRTSLPKVIFQWGPPILGFVVYCTLETCSIKYTRFTALGVPVRAEATITIAEEPSWAANLNTNPTSGGLPGRQQHTMVQGENIVNVANRRYEDPRVWRDIANVNNVDDPLRVRPGRRVYLPAPEEVNGGRSG
jgi:nucleoid-associated protein YgaU